MESGEEQNADPWDDFQWDPASEAQLQAIEASFSSANKRSFSVSVSVPPPDPDSSRETECRRLPDWSAPAPAPCRVNKKAKYQAMRFGGRIEYCQTADEVERAGAEILDKIKARDGIGPVPLGFDIEWQPSFRRGETPRKAAVMQICIGTTCCYVMHIIHSGIPPTLKSLLEDSSSIKVGICIANDAWKVSNDYNVLVQPLMDISALANIKLAGPARKWSLSSLTETITCKELKKPNNIRMGNWETDILSKEQLQYDATDAFASWFLYKVLNGMANLNIEKEKHRKINNA